MGRRPNSLILQYFERGPKLADNSNRYPHTCKACGENFPKGRIDSLTNHLTKKCPAISEADRINACLTLHGIHHATQRSQKPPPGQANGSSVDLPMIQRDWTALETLAEVSRQIEASEKHDDRGQSGQTNHAGPSTAGPGQAPATPAPNGPEHFELQEQFTLDNPPVNQENRQPKDKKTGPKSSPEAGKDLLAEENLAELIQSATDSANLTMAAAAAARLQPAVLDPQLLAGDEATPATPDTPVQSIEQQADGESANPPAPNSSQPWGEITYMSDSLHQANPGEALAQSAAALAHTGFQMQTGNSLNGAKARHSRARFDAVRRKEVQEVRKIGACIRCRILRKTCSPGSPCDTCRKVLSPRVWRSGCLRTKFSEQLDLYTAGVQIVLAQHRVNALKASTALAGYGLVMEACHFPDGPTRLSFNVLQAIGTQSSTGNPDENLHTSVMIDTDNQDVPGLMEAYMREVMPEFLQREPSHFMRVTLDTSLAMARETNDDLLTKALELWGIVEILDRERQWSIRVKPDPATDDNSGWIKDDTQVDVFTTICLQLSAAAERKAASTSKNLLAGMQRALQDSKIKVGYSMYFATLILLHCAEKSTWAFKAWEQDNLRPMWPLEKAPNNFTSQGYVIADLLRMLLGIRKALPRTTCDESTGMLVTLEQDPVIRSYFENLRLNYSLVQSRQEQPLFSPTDPRSFELLFCSTLLLPSKE